MDIELSFVTKNNAVITALKYAADAIPRVGEVVNYRIDGYLSFIVVDVEYFAAKNEGIGCAVITCKEVDINSITRTRLELLQELGWLG